jgi:hypothetical protein
MRFLKWCYLTLREWFVKPESDLAAVVQDRENLSRFIFSRRHFSQQPARVKAEAFMPDSGEVSVFRVDHLAETEIWRIGSSVVRRESRTLHARGDILAHDVKRNSLDVVPSEPPPQHAAIVGWPENDKGRQKLIALELARASVLIMNS